MPWNQIATYRLVLEPAGDGEKKPSAKTPPLEMSRSPGVSDLPLVNWSSDMQTQIIRRSRSMKMVRQVVPILPSLFYADESGATKMASRYRSGCGTWTWPGGAITGSEPIV